MSKIIPIAIGLLVIVSLGASSAWAGGGPDTPEGPESSDEAAEWLLREIGEAAPIGIPVVPDPGPAPGTPGIPTPGDRTPTPPAPPEGPEAPDPEPEGPTTPEHVPDAPAVPADGVPSATPPTPEEAQGRIGEILVPIRSTADAIGDAAVLLITGSIDSGARMVDRLSGKAMGAGAGPAGTVKGVIALILESAAPDDDDGRYGSAQGLAIGAADTNVVQDANRAAAVTLFAIGSMGAAFVGFALLRRALGLAGVALLSRIPSKDIMKNGTRAAVHEIVQTDPGVSLNEIVERLGISRNAVAYHLAVFEQEATMVSIKDGKYRRYFVNGGKFANGAKVVVSTIRNDITRNVAAFIAKNPGVIQKDVCAAVGTSPSATNWHIGRLEKVGLVAKLKVANTVQYQPGPSLAKYDLSDFGLRTAPVDAVA